LEECLRFLEEKNDYPTDLLLVYIVRAQLICNDVAVVPWNDAFGISGTGVPWDFYVKTFTSQLETLKRAIPPELESNGKLLDHSSPEIQGRAIYLRTKQKHYNSTSSMQ
jgi:hypothetical protein